MNQSEERVEGLALGLIAAGEGSRLRKEGLNMPKGLVPVGGVPMIRRTIEAFVECGISAVTCIVNEESPTLADYLSENDFGVPVQLIVRSTPSSMHSLFALAPLLQSSPFFLATVDAIYRPDNLAAYVERCRSASDADGVLAVTDLIDDERPLYVRMDGDRRITAIGEKAEGSDWITAGLYYFRPNVFDLIPIANELGMQRLRNFQGMLVDRGYRIFGHPFGDVVDVDHRADIERAEGLLTEWGMLGSDAAPEDAIRSDAGGAR